MGRVEATLDAAQPLLDREPSGDLGPAHAIFVHEDDAGGPILPAGPPRDGTTRLQATINVVNIYMGIGLLSMPYAMRLGGWLGLGALFLATTTFCYSGRLLVHAFDKLGPGIAHTYPALGVAAIGPAGKYLVGSLAMTEYFAASALMLIVMWKEMLVLARPDGLLTQSVFTAIVGASLSATLPMLFIPSFKRLSWLSSLGCVCSILITLTVLACVATDPTRSKMPHQPPPSRDWAAWGVFQSLGLFAISMSGHSGLPVLRSSMKERQAFDSVLVAGFSLMALVYALVAAAGYYYFGDRAAEIITDSLASDSPLAGRSLLLPGLTIDRVVAACILLKAYTTYPSLIMVLQDMLWSLLPWGSGTRYRAPGLAAVYAIRLGFFVAGAALAYLAFGFLGDVMSLVGGFCSLSCSLLMPAGFHLSLYWKEVSRGQRVRGIALLLMGTFLMFIIVGQSLESIASKINPSGDGGHGGKGDALLLTAGLWRAGR